MKCLFSGNINIKRLLILTLLFVLSTICFHFLQYHTELDQFQPPIVPLKPSTIKYSFDKRKFFSCTKQYKVAFTFDDGPHPLSTKSIIQILNKEKITGGFFLLGTSIQSFLSYHRNSSIDQFERPRIGFLLIQDYSLIENLLRGHEIYLHGWLHEKITEMRLQTVIDNISTQLLEIGLLKGFKPVYRAPWGIGTSPSQVKNKALITEILTQMGIIPAYWDIDTKDYMMNVDENILINNTLKMICRTHGGHILMHDNRPKTASILQRVILAIRFSGHLIVSPSDINSSWNDPKRLNQTREYVQLLRQRVLKIQNSYLLRTEVGRTFRLVSISFKNKQNQNSLLFQINPMDSLKYSFELTPNINHLKQVSTANSSRHS